MSSLQPIVKQAGDVATVRETRLKHAQSPASSTNVPDKKGALQPIAHASVQLAGEFGRRVQKITEANILQIDVDQTFLQDFRKRGEGGYVGLGKFIDALVRLAAAGDTRLVALKEKTISAVIETQETDGYIGTIEDPQSRIKVLWDLHEGAYLIWALVSDHQFFSSAASLEAAQRLANFIIGRFTVEPAMLDEIRPYGFPFEVVSLGLHRALLALSRATGQSRYREFVVDVLKLTEYGPPIQCGTIDGANHSSTYMGCCLAQLELYRENGNPWLLEGARRVVSFLRQGEGLLVTGSCSQWECWHDTQSGIGNSSETCASVYLARLLETMLRLEGDSLYGDIMERDIYNGLFAATSPDGTASRYFTPFEGERLYDSNGYRYCCANNNKRFLADLRSWMYYRTDTGVAVNLYNASTLTVGIGSDVTLLIEQQTDYPSSGDVRLKIDPSAAASFELKLRIPRWCKEATVSISGSQPETVRGGQFLGLSRTWKPGDVVDLKMPMEWRLVRGRQSQAGRAAILRGPVLFTFNPERNSELVALPGFEPSLIKINPLEIGSPVADDSVRPGGQSCVIKAWPPSATNNPWVFIERVPVVLTEYPDPNGRSVYFMVPGVGQEILTDDELIAQAE